MQSERRDLKYTFKGLTDEQVVEKKRMLKESAEMHPEIAEYFRELQLAVDFCVRFPEEATKQRETKEWEQIESAFSPKKMAVLRKPRTKCTEVRLKCASTPRPERERRG